jgi:hypothetical protein
MVRTSDRVVVVMGVGRRFVVGSLVVLGLTGVTVDERRVVVLVKVVPRAVLELAEYTTGVVVRDVIMVVGVNHRLVGVLALLVTGDPLGRGRLLHDRPPLDGLICAMRAQADLITVP